MTKEQLGTILLAAFHCDHPRLKNVQAELVALVCQHTERVDILRALEIARDAVVAVKGTADPTSVLRQVRAAAADEQRRAEVAMTAVESLRL